MENFLGILFMYFLLRKFFGFFAKNTANFNEQTVKPKTNKKNVKVNSKNILTEKNGNLDSPNTDLSNF